MTEDELKVEEILSRFISERHLWEVESYSELLRAKESNQNTSEVFKNMRPKLQAIYDQFLTVKERKYTLAFNSFSSNPSYDPDNEPIEEIITKNKNRIVVRTTTKQVTGNRPNEYVFIKQNSKWKLDNKKTFWNFKDKWESTQL